MIDIIVFILGLVIGSFLNVCIFRIPKGQSIAYPPSHCMKCGKEIKWYDLIPVISYILIKGKCRYCGDKISIRYPLIELITGILFWLLYIENGLTISFAKYAIMVIMIIVIGMIDFDTTDVYDSTIMAAVAAAVVFVILAYFNHENPLDYILGGGLGGGVISIIILITGSMGWGDAEICLFLGLFFGLKLTILMLMLSFIIGGITGVFLVFLKKAKMKQYIAFGPFIAIASIITVLFGTYIINWYMGFFI